MVPPNAPPIAIGGRFLPRILRRRPAVRVPPAPSAASDNFLRRERTKARNMTRASFHSTATLREQLGPRLAGLPLNSSPRRAMGQMPIRWALSPPGMSAVCRAGAVRRGMSKSPPEILPRRFPKNLVASPFTGATFDHRIL